jgi:ribosomal protein L37AE/L43A/flagellar motility protein MotE (MotC chaperone)
MSKNLSQSIADLFAKPTESKELSSRIQRLGDEIRKVIQNDDTIYGKFRGFLESFREIIPDEQQRYHAALKALSTTSKLSRQEIIKAVNGQLEELKIVEKGLMPSLSGWRDELKAMEARSKETKNEIAKLRERIAQLESEEKTVLSGMAAREKDLEVAEKTIRDIFANIGAEITSLNKKVEALPAEGPAEQPTPPAAQPTPQKPSVSDASGEKTGGGAQKIEIQGAPALQDTKWQKKCPMCGGPFTYHELENMWQCYTCGHEESTKVEAQGTGDKKSDFTPAPGPSSDSSSSFVEPLSSMVNEHAGSKKGTSLSDTVPAAQKKTCPSCGKTMFWYPNEKAWRCPSCHYERRI